MDLFSLDVMTGETLSTIDDLTAFVCLFLWFLLFSSINLSN